MNYDPDRQALIWLAACTDLERRERVALLRAAGSPAKLFRDFEKIFAQVIKKEPNGVYKEGERRRALARAIEDLERKGRFAVTVLDPDYPAPLKAADPPVVLFGEGNRALLQEKMFCIVGSRTTPPWAEAQGKKVASELTRSFVIVTGLAEGGDCAAIRGALPEGRLVSVLPCGLDECYPAAHSSLKREIARKGLLLSECAPNEKVRRYSFHARNRILAGLAEGVLVLSAGEKSGALITANDAAEYGRDVFAFPYSLGVASGVGCNELIKKGAFLATGAEDILQNYGISAQPAARAALTETEKKVLGVLGTGEELHTAVLSERLGMPVYELIAVLSALELKGLAVKSGGNRYKAI